MKGQLMAVCSAGCCGTIALCFHVTMQVPSQVMLIISPSILRQTISLWFGLLEIDRFPSQDLLILHT